MSVKRPLRNPKSPALGSFWPRLRQTRARLRELRNWEPEKVRQRARRAPKISVMLITYNHERFVAQALRSIISQKRKFNIEINVIDDASTDRTQEIVRAYQKRYPGLINCYFNSVNAGRIATQLNTIRGFMTLRGEYFALLEGDDYWTDRNKLAKQIAFLDKNPGYVACAHQTLKVYDDGSKPPEHFLPFKAFGRNRASIRSLIRMDGVFHLSSIIYRNVFGLRPPLALSDPYSCEVTINMLFGVFGDFFCLDDYMSAYRVHGNGSFSTRSQEDIWLFHLGGFRRFALYLGPRYWGTFVRTVFSFSRFVLSAPRRGEVTHLSGRARAIAWLHLAVAALLLMVLAPLEFVTRVWQRIYQIVRHEKSALNSSYRGSILPSIYWGLIAMMPDAMIHGLLAAERKFVMLRTVRLRLKGYMLRGYTEG